ncbi:ABC transporter ATP-binding protein [Mesoaciditoga lauensis]|uniref:ABC transporter ATP-binding protein n=1 Tax=Mesoaciditoga lauensis TaxID=1495039 RepID=UPI00056515BD|nr:ABC transporter ATP-binding protein [Mesoaciditoga lauensis]
MPNKENQFIFKYYKRYLPLMILALASSTVVVLTVLPYPIIFKYFIDTVIPRKEMIQVVKWSIFLAVIVVIRIIFNFIQNYTASIIEQRVSRDLKMDLMQKTLRLPLNFFVKNNTGSIMSRILNDASRSVGFFRNYYLELYNSVFLIVASLILMFRIDWILSLLSLAILPALFLTTNGINKKMSTESRKMSKANQDVMKEVEEGLSAIETVKVDDLYKKVTNRFLEKLNAMLRINLNINKYGAFAGSMLTGLVAIGPILLLGVGTYIVIIGKTSIGSVVAITTFLTFLYEPVQKVALARTSIQMPKMILKNVKELLEQQEERLDGLKPTGYDISFENVAFSYDGKNQVLSDLSLKVKEGEFAAIIGKTGEGKSTILKLISKFYLPQKGDIKIGDNSIRDISGEELRNMIAYVNRNEYIFQGTIFENLTLSGKASKNDIDKVIKEVYLDEEVEKLGGYENALVGSKGTAISDGQKARIGMARAILKEPKIFLIDEILSTVNSKIESKIVENIRKEFPKASIVFVSHRMSSIKSADRIYLLENGKNVANGKYEEIKETEKFNSLFSEKT